MCSPLLALYILLVFCNLRIPVDNSIICPFNFRCWLCVMWSTLPSLSPPVLQLHTWLIQLKRCEDNLPVPSLAVPLVRSPLKFDRSSFHLEYEHSVYEITNRIEIQWYLRSSNFENSNQWCARNKEILRDVIAENMIPAGVWDPCAGRIRLTITPVLLGQDDNLDRQRSGREMRWRSPRALVLFWSCYLVKGFVQCFLSIRLGRSRSENIKTKEIETVNQLLTYVEIFLVVVVYMVGGFYRSRVGRGCGASSRKGRFG